MVAERPEVDLDNTISYLCNGLSRPYATKRRISVIEGLLLLTVSMPTGWMPASPSGTHFSVTTVLGEHQCYIPNP